MEMNRKTIKQQKRVGEEEDGKWEGELMRERMVWLARSGSSSARV
jgi:hypothetical protein